MTIRPPIFAGLALLTGSLAVAGYSLIKATDDPIDNKQALQDGCRNDHVWERVLPEYVQVKTARKPLVEGTVVEALVSHTDFPLTHDSHDVNFMVKPYPSYAGMLSDQPETEGGVPVIECEWEEKYFDSRFWPEIGDATWCQGRFIWDCGHVPYHSEIHPPYGVATTRYEGYLPPGANYPVQVLKTFVFFGGRGGYWNKPVPSDTYEIPVYLGPKPDDDSELVARVLDKPFGGPTPDVRAVGEGENKEIRITYDLSEQLHEVSTRFGAIIVSGWKPGTPTETFRELRVTIQSFKAKENHDTVGDGEWHLWVSINGRVIQIFNETDISQGDKYDIGKSVTLILPESVPLTVRTTGYEDDMGGEFGVRETWGQNEILKLIGAGADGDDRIGNIRATFKGSDGHGVGGHSIESEKNVDSDTEVDFELVFTVEELRKWTPPKTRVRSLRPSKEKSRSGGD